MQISRRKFIGSSMASAGLLLSRRASAARISANERIQVALIGAGAAGQAHLKRLLNNPQVRVLAASDPDQHQLKAALDLAAQSGQEILPYSDFRDMLLAHADIDAVFVATPDHWHALATIHCLRLGKDVYCEAPLARTIAEGREIVNTAQRYGRIVQTGTDLRSQTPHVRQACELVRNGRIGTLERIVCFAPPNPQQPYVPNEEPPSHLDWELWLGPAPWRPYNRQIHPKNFRYFRDFSGGGLTDPGVHLFDIAQWAAAKEETSPRRVEVELSEMYAENFFEFPARSRIRFDYDGILLEWRQGEQETSEIEPGQHEGVKFYGTEGEVFVNRESYRARGIAGAALDEALPDSAGRLPISTDHLEDFFHSMRTRKPPISHAALGHRAATISHLGNIATWLGRPVTFDPQQEQFPGDDAANRLLQPPMRAPWTL